MHEKPTHDNPLIVWREMSSHNVHIDKVSSCVQTEHAFSWHYGLLKFCYNRDKQSCSIRPPFSVFLQILPPTQDTV